MTNARLRKLTTLYSPSDDRTTLDSRSPSSHISQTHNIRHITHTNQRSKNLQTTQLRPEEYANGTWLLPNILYDALDACFNIHRFIHCDPNNLPLIAKTYISHDFQYAIFGALPYTKSARLGASLALPDYKAD
jgi:hypothetical protein